MNETTAAPTSYRVRDDLIEGWWVWMSPKSRQWHGRQKGSEPPVLVHADSLEALREEVRLAA
jgi:hypothetical protein